LRRAFSASIFVLKGFDKITSSSPLYSNSSHLMDIFIPRQATANRSRKAGDSGQYFNVTILESFRKSLLGDQERDLHVGGLVFIPANTWVSLKNMGTEPISLTFVFSAPRIRRHDAMQFRASRGSAHANHARAAERVRTLRTC